MHKHFIQFSTAAILGLGLTLSVAQAQDQQAPPAGRRGGQMGPERQIERMRQQLNLTDVQVSQIRPILAESQKQMMALRGDSTMSQDDRRAKMMSIHQDSTAKIKALLSDTQKSQYDQMMAKQMQERREHMGGNGEAPPPPPNQ
jgi:Spy/CpxP family protein refolding chaperone